MKKYLLTFCLLIIPICIFCQVKYGYLTLKYGRSYSTYKYTNATKYFNSEFLESPNWQIEYNHPVSPFFALGFGVNFITRGAKLEEYYQSYQINADYVDIYLDASYYFLGQKKLLQPYIYVKPGWGICKGGEIYNSLEVPYLIPLNTTNYRKFNYSFSYGLGLEFKIPTGKLGFEITHDIGLSNTYSNSDFYNYQGETRKNRGYIIKLKYSLSTKYIVILIDELSYLIWKINNPKYPKSVRHL